MNRVSRGFSLPELLVVVVIISLIASVGFAQFQESRKQARDDRRKIDVEQLAVAVRLYYEQYGEFPCESGSNCSSHNGSANSEIGDGDAIDGFLSPYLEVIPADPLGPGDATYLYYYDGRAECSGGDFAVVHAIGMEVPSNGNWSSVCGADNDGGPTADTYTVIVGNSSG